MHSYSQPLVPSLYFETHKKNTIINNNNDRNRSEHVSTPQPSSSTELPPELLTLCLTTYANWGDLAKLACVQKSWSNIIMDTADQSPQAKWELAQAMLYGDCGLQKSPTHAMKILKEMTHNVVVTDESGKPISIEHNNNDNNNESNQTTAQNNHDEPEPRHPSHLALAIKKIAECYLDGFGVLQNKQLGLAWLQAAFDYMNDADAAHDVAVIYEYGRYGIDVDVVAAAQWFERAANHGNVEAMTELGLCYELGCGVEQSDEKALDWYTKAANLGHATAKFSVREIFEEARGVPQSDEEACLWYYRAALVGDEDSKIALRRLYDIARIVVPGVAEILNE